VLSALGLLTGWLLYASLALATGVVFARWLILPSSSQLSTDSEPIFAAAARVGLAASVGLVIATLLYLARQLIEFHDPFAPWADDARLLVFQLAWGRTWRIAFVAALIAVAGFAMAARRLALGWGIATLAILALGAFPGMTGHANAGDLRAVTLPADILHVWAVGGWIGALTLVLLLERRRVLEAGPSLLPTLVPRFSRLALPSVIALVASGVLAAWVHLESLGALVGTRYGRLLLLKLAIVAAVLPLGAMNWRRLKPRLSDSAAQTSMRRLAILEVALAAIVLAVTAILVRTDPSLP
jgi:copper transport protein